MHGGGRDLIFPHHENELAQSCAAGRPFAQVWAHNGLLRLAGEKMSKSRGNIERLHDALDRLPVETFLMYLLRGHYAGPIDYTEDALAQAGAACATLREKLRAGSGADPALIAKVREVLEDDFNTPKALALPVRGAAQRARLDRRGTRAVRSGRAGARADGACRAGRPGRAPAGSPGGR